MPKRIEVEQAEIKVDKYTYFATQIPTATSGSWYTVHDACEVWGAVAIDLDVTIIGWRNPPNKQFIPKIEAAIRQAFNIPTPIEVEKRDAVRQALKKASRRRAKRRK